MGNHRASKTPRPVRVPAPFDETATWLAITTQATVDQAECLLHLAQGDGRMAAYGCELMAKGWTYTDTRTVVLWMTATGTPAPPLIKDRQDPIGAIEVEIRALNRVVGITSAITRALAAVYDRIAR